MAERILPTEAQAPASTPHAYNDPELSPIAFLHAVYRATHLPMSIRIEAASALLPYTNSFPRSQTIPPRCKIIIGGLGPCPADDPTENHSQNPDFVHKTLTRDDDPGDPQNLTTTPEPSTFIDSTYPCRAPTNQSRGPHTPTQLRSLSTRPTLSLCLWPLAHLPM
jgi:hypothetical protein